MESSKFGKGLFIPWYELLKLYLVPDTIAAPLHKQKHDGKKRSQSALLQSAMFSRTSYSVFSRGAWVSESRHMEASHLQRWGHPVTVGSRRVTDAPADQRGRPAQQQNHSFNLTFNTLVNRAAATEHALRAHYENTFTDNKTVWRGKKNLSAYKLMGLGQYHSRPC